MAGSFASARVERLIREAGAFRVSADAVSRMNEIVTEYSSFSKTSVPGGTFSKPSA